MARDADGHRSRTTSCPCAWLRKKIQYPDWGTIRMTLGTTTYKSHELKNENMIYELTLTYTPRSLQMSTTIHHSESGMLELLGSRGSGERSSL